MAKDIRKHPNVLAQKKLTDKSQERVSSWFNTDKYTSVPKFGQLKKRRKR